uniref:(California timema) hypothetical protein n=1 Tax=Timema californicum TaxID=61474 RepID=A0A7R9J6M0_TIMCA|nr:unnamed protein product [Timema californicum]
MLYALAHFSKFVPPGSVHIGLDTDDDTGIENIAFLTPDNVTVVILQNRVEEVDPHSCTFPLYQFQWTQRKELSTLMFADVSQCWSLGDTKR